MFTSTSSTPISAAQPLLRGEDFAQMNPASSNCTAHYQRGVLNNPFVTTYSFGAATINRSSATTCVQDGQPAGFQEPLRNSTYLNEMTPQALCVPSSALAGQCCGDAPARRAALA